MKGFSESGKFIVWCRHEESSNLSIKRRGKGKKLQIPFLYNFYTGNNENDLGAFSIITLDYSGDSTLLPSYITGWIHDYIHYQKALCGVAIFFQGLNWSPILFRYE